MKRTLAINTHPNTRIVTLYRKPSFISGAQQGSAPEFMAMSKRSIGSFWENSFSRTVGSGLNFSEQKILLPTIVDCEPDDRNFRTKVAEYYNSVKTAIPFDKGRNMEIGLEISNTEPLSSENSPLNLADYITYRHALAHPEVASSKQNADDDMLKLYYIFDSQAQEDFLVDQNKDKDAALGVYLKVTKQQPEKIDMLLTLLGTDPRLFSGKNATALKLEKIKGMSLTQPGKLLEVYTDKFFEETYLLKTMLNTSILQKVGKSIINPETGTTLGHTMLEAISWVKDPINSETLVLLKARMQEGLSKPLPSGSK